MCIMSLVYSVSEPRDCCVGQVPPLRLLTNEFFHKAGLSRKVEKIDHITWLQRMSGYARCVRALPVLWYIG